MKRCLIWLCILILFSKLGFAGNTYDIGADLLEDERQKQQEERLKEPLSSITVEEKEFEKKEDLEKVKFYVAEIIVHGNTVLSKKLLDKIINKYKGRNLSLNDISELTHKITGKYIEKGYAAARVVIPNQNLKETKNLVLNIVQGFIEDIIYIDVEKEEPGPEVKSLNKDKDSDIEEYELLSALFKNVIADIHKHEQRTREIEIKASAPIDDKKTTSYDNLDPDIKKVLLRYEVLEKRVKDIREKTQELDQQVDSLTKTVKSINKTFDKYAERKNKKSDKKSVNTLREKIRISTAFPINKEDILNTRKLDQGMDNYNRLPSNNVELFMLPGDTPGGSKILLKGKRQDVFRGKIAYDNTGSRSTGKDKIRLQLENDNLLGLNDTITLYDISSKSTNALALNYSVPFRNWLFTYDWTYSEYLSLLENQAEMFGKVRNSSITAYRTLYRDAVKKFGMKFSYNRKKSVRFYNDIQLTPQPLTVLRGGWDFEYRGQKDSWYLDMNYSKGIGYKSTIDEPDAGEDVPHAQFQKLDAGITYFRSLAERLSYKGSIKSQYSYDTLYSSEQIFVGGVDTVRGYVDSPAVGDSGVYMQNEISTQIGKTKFQPYVFADLGMTYNKPLGKEEYLSGAGLGLRYNSKKIVFDASYGVPLWESASVNQDNDKGEFYISITVKVL